MAQAAWAAIGGEAFGEKGWTDRTKLVTSDFHDHHKSLSETVAHVLGSGLSCTIFALHSDTLPPELLVSADHLVRIEPPDRSVIAEAAYEPYGFAPATCSLTDAGAATLTPVDLMLAYRPDETADAFMGRLEDLLGAREAARPAEHAVPERKTIRSEPSLDRLHGMNEATAWGRSLVRDLSAYRAGELPWERRPVQRDALARQHLGLPIQRQGIAELADYHMRDQGFRRHPAVNRPRRCFRYDDRLLATPAGVTRAAGDANPHLRRHDVELFGAQLPDAVLRAAAAGTRLRCGVDRGDLAAAPAARSRASRARGVRGPSIGLPYSRTARRRRALAMTDTELSDIASAATTGLSRIPNAG